MERFGDKVRVNVFGEADLSGEFQIDSNGRISLPLIGDVQAAGETAASLEQHVEAKLSDGYLQSPRVGVEITTYRPFYVIGEVNNLLGGPPELPCPHRRGEQGDDPEDRPRYKRRDNRRGKNT